MNQLRANKRFSANPSIVTLQKAPADAILRDLSKTGLFIQNLKGISENSLSTFTIHFSFVTLQKEFTFQAKAKRVDSSGCGFEIQFSNSSESQLWEDTINMYEKFIHKSNSIDFYIKSDQSSNLA